jgi:hypothetical protein
VNLQQYADHRKALGLRGATHVSVLRAIKNDRLRPPAVERQGKGWEIDPGLADEQWAQATDPAPRGTNASQDQKPIPKAATPATTKPLKPSQSPAPDLADDDLDAEPDINDEKVPNFNDERALHEREKRLIARMERKEKANALLPREELLQAQDAAINITRTVMLGVPSKAKQRIPHLTPDEVAVLLDLIREALQNLASFDVATQYPLKEL